MTKINDALESEPELVNSEPYDGGWMIEVEVEGDLDEQLQSLLTAEQYEQFLNE